ncbi:YraN family protein [Nocardioides zeae]|uniref:UPF0102 protein RDV89_12385 n=1 Tax=Nocardioides imazamoxiresistens TaxID=3231893 RepID=A0ABU3PXA5_9ACTN|nr:YraN family protein [Nocardioides zeae]MDT9593872.1 YraN family protein [Nocardioides zeae]
MTYERAAMGAYGEQLAERHLVAEGMTLLDRNWRCELGEIDLVLRDGATLVVCEVKTRSSEAYGTPFEAVDALKLQRLRRLASRWMRAHGVHARHVRIDMVGVIRPRKGPSTLEHVAGIG